MNKKAEKEIRKTKRTLKKYGCTFKEYMKNIGKRYDIDLGDSIDSNCIDNRLGIIVGWNISSNYRVFVISTEALVIVHPDSVKLLKGEKDV